MNRIWPIGLGFGALLCAHTNAIAADVVPYQEYGNYIDKHRTVQALDSSVFGEQVSLRDGSVSFRIADAELAGIGPTIRVVRSFHIKTTSKTNETAGNQLGNWELEIPRLKTVTANELGTIGQSPYGWQVPAVNKNARCAEFYAPGLISFVDPYRHWEPQEWWSGYQLVDDGGSVHEVLKTNSAYTAAAGSTGITAANWKITCLPTTANGQPGDAFLATAPDGTRYWFNYLVYATGDTLIKPMGAFAPPGMKDEDGESTSEKAPNLQLAPVNNELKRRYAAMLVTRIEDRFGNWLTYQYTGGLLARIDASDGRLLTVTRNPSNVVIALGSSAGTRSWTYAISGTNLTTVTQPDGSAWSYNFGALSNAPTIDESSGRGGACETLLSDYAGPGTLVGTATAPSGGTATYTFGERHFGRSYVHKECWGPTGGDYAVSPADWMAYALTQRSISGPGIATQTWAYTYSPANASWYENCTGGCVSEIWTDVTAPDGVRQRSTFSNRLDETENLLLKEQTYTGSSVLVRTVLHTYATVPYATAWPYAWPAAIGEDLQLRTNYYRSERWAPAVMRQIQQQGRTFTWQVPSTCNPGGTSACFDTFARPTKVTKTSSP